MVLDDVLLFSSTVSSEFDVDVLFDCLFEFIIFLSLLLELMKSRLFEWDELFFTSSELLSLVELLALVFVLEKFSTLVVEFLSLVVFESVLAAIKVFSVLFVDSSFDFNIELLE